MADALYHLSEDFSWTPTSTPEHQLVLINDTVEASGSFLIHHFLSLFLKANHRVFFVGFSNSKDHYTAVARKLGMSLPSAEAKKKLLYMDAFQTPLRGKLDSLISNIRLFIAQVDSEEPVSIIFDDLSPIKWEFGISSTISFVRCCRALAKQTKVNFFFLHHADTETPTDEKLLNPALSDLASVVFSVTPLATGYCKDVHGTLTVQRQIEGYEKLTEKLSIPYKVLENTVKCFRSGGDALKAL